MADLPSRTPVAPPQPCRCSLLRPVPWSRPRASPSTPTPRRQVSRATKHAANHALCNAAAQPRWSRLNALSPGPRRRGYGERDPRAPGSQPGASPRAVHGDAPVKVCARFRHAGWLALRVDLRHVYLVYLYLRCFFPRVFPPRQKRSSWLTLLLVPRAV